ANAGAALAAQVPRELPAKLRAAGATDAAERVQSTIDGFATGLAGGARTACQAGKQRREWSPELVAKSESCLDVAARSARALLAIETVTAASAPDIVRRVNRTLPDLVSCTSPTYLAASPPVPTDPAQLEAVITARTDVSIARTELEVHAIDRARPHLERLASSPVRTSPLVAPGIAVVDGMLAFHHGELAKAEKLLADAYYAARAADDDLITSVALGQLLMMTTERAADDPASRSWLRITVADAERLSARAPWLAARMYVAAARVADATGDSPGALRHLERTRALAPAGDPVIVQGWLVEAGVLMWTGKVAEGIALYDRAIALEIERLGADHPDIGQILSDYAASLIAADREADAIAIAERALAIVERSADPNDRLVDDVRVNVAAVLIDDNARARALLETARANYIAHDGVRNSKVANVDNNLAVLLLDDGKPEQAIVMLEESLATTEQLLGADRTEVAEVLFNLAVAHRAKGDYGAALAAARRCADIYGAKRPGTDRHRTSLAMVAAIANQRRDHATALAATETALGFPKPPEDPQSTAWPQLERARALIAVKRKAEARPLLAAARASYAAIGLPGRVEEIDRLVAQTR
nr:tetratricopeptide repeat protein [Deltaproteobacteria bacterium]